MICPKCSAELVLEGRTFKCLNGHCFDRAKQGYVNLSMKQKASGDNKEMVKARSRFLEKGYYGFLRDELEKLMKENHPQVYLDLGCGQGWYTKKLAEHADQSYGIDLSKEAVHYAAAHDKKTQYIVGSIFHLPFKDDSVDVMTSVFTPIPEQEAWRVLKKDGLLITVSPDAGHHRQLKEVLYEQVRLNDAPPVLESFEKVDEIHLSKTEHVMELMDLLEMTPYRYKSPRKGIEALEAIQDGLDVDFQFVIQIWRKKYENKD
ncbi:MAG: methyltransferase domain-containing protein [Ileibacterium sp.]|nr:methyltransferase domain-containing protein [Ileibacterium sp.]